MQLQCETVVPMSETRPLQRAPDVFIAEHRGLNAVGFEALDADELVGVGLSITQ